jgi:hypothetical protein
MCESALNPSDVISLQSPRISLEFHTADKRTEFQARALPRTRLRLCKMSQFARSILLVP